MSEPCPRAGNCQFEARYDATHPTLSKAPADWVPSKVIEAIEASKSKTYIHDICVRCGKIVPREAKDP